MLLQNLIVWGVLYTEIHQIFFVKGSLADNLPNIPTIKVSLLMVLPSIGLTQAH